MTRRGIPRGPSQPSETPQKRLEIIDFLTECGSID
jgi:hypothetical protein